MNKKFLDVFEIERQTMICLSGQPNSSIGDWEDLIKYNSNLGPNIFFVLKVHPSFDFLKLPT